jgi:hypothetical protein
MFNVAPHNRLHREEKIGPLLTQDASKTPNQHDGQKQAEK